MKSLNSVLRTVLLKRCVNKGTILEMSFALCFVMLCLCIEQSYPLTLGLLHLRWSTHTIATTSEVILKNVGKQSIPETMIFLKQSKAQQNPA